MARGRYLGIVGSFLLGIWDERAQPAHLMEPGGGAGATGTEPGPHPGAGGSADQAAAEGAGREDGGQQGSDREG